MKKPLSDCAKVALVLGARWRQNANNDGSRFGEFAVPAAMSVARELQAQIELISVFEEESVLAGSEPTTQQFKEWLYAYLEEIGAHITELSGVPTSCTIIDGSPADWLTEYAFGGTSGSCNFALR